jgi:large subunit ribosomal protein L18
MIPKSKLQSRIRRHLRLRQKVCGTAARPRMSVCFTGQHVYVQFVDDQAHRTLATVSTLSPEAKGTRATVDGARKIGALAAQKAKEHNITEVVFDRGGFTYHGRVKALADAARETGLQF